MNGMTFDQVERYRGAALIVERIRKAVGMPDPRILDIGGFFRTLAGTPLLPGPKMIPDCDFRVVDVEPAELPGYQVVVPGQPLPFAADEFQITICMDVLEHIAPASRVNFVEDALRVTSGVLILGAPFQHPARVAADRWLAEYLDVILGDKNPMLQEHLRHGLPDAGVLRVALDVAGLRYFSFPNGDLGQWRTVMAVKHLVQLAKGAGISMEFEREMMPWADPVCVTEPGYRDMFIVFRNRDWDTAALEADIRSHLELARDAIWARSGDEAAAVVGRYLEMAGATIGELGRIRIHDRLSYLRLQGELTAQWAISDELVVQNRQQALSIHEKSLSINEMATQLEKYRGLERHLAEYDRGLAELRRSAVYRTGKIVLAPIKMLVNLLKHEPGSDSSPGPVDSCPGSVADAAATPNGCITASGPVRDKDPGTADPLWKDPRIGGMSHRFVFSILVPVYNTDERVFRAMLDSVLAQSYPLWQLCLVDDASPDEAPRRIVGEYARREPERIRYEFSETNGGIAVATNRAAALATGEFVCLLDHDDLLDPEALMEVALRLHLMPETDYLYSDEDKVSQDGREFSQAYFKPDFDPELLMCNNYLNHFSVIRRDVFRDVGGFREGFDGSQDYDLYLRVTEKAARIVHIPKVLYHWRMVPDSTAVDPEAKGGMYRESSFRALREAVTRRGLDATVEQGLSPGSYRVRHRVAERKKVCIIIPTRNALNLVETCIASIRRYTRYENYEILVVDNNSDDPVLGIYLEEERRRWRNTRRIAFPGRFNFSQINNFAVKNTDAEYLLFMNNDIEATVEGWLESMLEYAQYPEIGAVGAKLLYPDGTIQHAGVMLGMGGIAGHPFKGIPEHNCACFGHTQMVKDYSAVTAACMLMRREVFEIAGGFNEELAVSFGDIDICMEIRRLGYRIVYTPYARMIHHESVSRKDDNEMPRRPRFHSEITYMISKWGKTLYAGSVFKSQSVDIEV